VQEHKPAELEVILKALHSFVASATRSPVKPLGAKRSCRLERTQLTSQSHLRLSTTIVEKRWWTGHLFGDAIRDLTAYIADICSLYKLPLKKVVIKRKCIRKHEESGEVTEIGAECLWMHRGRLQAVRAHS